MCLRQSLISSTASCLGIPGCRQRRRERKEEEERDNKAEDPGERTVAHSTQGGGPWRAYCCTLNTGGEEGEGGREDESACCSAITATLMQAQTHDAGQRTTAWARDDTPRMVEFLAFEASPSEAKDQSMALAADNVDVVQGPLLDEEVLGLLWERPIQVLAPRHAESEVSGPRLQSPEHRMPPTVRRCSGPCGVGLLLQQSRVPVS